MTTLHISSNVTSSAQLKNLGKFEKMFPGELKKAQLREHRWMGYTLTRLLRERSAQIYWKRRFQVGWRYKASWSYLILWNAEDHAVFVEKGRRPGAKPPPMKAILPWVQDKLGGDEQVAYRVAKSIGKKGIKARPVLTALSVQRAMDTELSKRLEAIWAKAAKASSLWGRMRGASGEL